MCLTPGILNRSAIYKAVGVDPPQASRRGSLAVGTVPPVSEVCRVTARAVMGEPQERSKPFARVGDARPQVSGRGPGRLGSEGDESWTECPLSTGGQELLSPFTWGSGHFCDGNARTRTRAGNGQSPGAWPGGPAASSGGPATWLRGPAACGRRPAARPPSRVRHAGG